MELNKYDLVDWVTSRFGDIHCGECPIQKECDEIERKRTDIPYLCKNKDITREALVKKYNL